MDIENLIHYCTKYKRYCLRLSSKFKVNSVVRVDFMLGGKEYFDILKVGPYFTDNTTSCMLLHNSAKGDYAKIVNSFKGYSFVQYYEKILNISPISDLEKILYL